MRLFSIFEFILFFLMGYVLAFASEETNIAYSDLMPENLKDLIYNDPVSTDKNYEADISKISAYKSGSLPIIEDFLANHLDLCIIALPEDSDLEVLEDAKIAKIPLCYKSSIIVVNSENPVS